MDSLPFPPPPVNTKGNARKMRMIGAALGCVAAVLAVYMAWQFFGGGIKALNAEVAGPVQVYRAAVPGRLLEVPVREGESVPAGALLYAQDDTLAAKTLAEARAALALAQRGVAGAELQAALAEEMEQLSRKASAQRKEEENARKAVEHWTAEYAKIMVGLRRPGLQPGKERDALVAEEARVRTELAQSTALWENLSLERAQTDASAQRLRRYPESALPPAVATELWQRRIASAEQELAATRAYAPTKGVVTWLGVKAGQDVKRDESVLAFSSAEDLWVYASFTPGNMLKLSVGTPCTVELDGVPHAGHITSLAPHPGNEPTGGLARITFDQMPEPMPYPGQVAKVTVR